MNYFDIIIGIILLVALVKGFKNGFVIELASLAALILGLLGAIMFSDVTAGFLSEYLQSGYIGLIAFFVTFLLIVVGVHLVAKMVDKMIKALALGPVNRIFGALFSLLKYAFIVSVLLSVFNSFDRSFKVIPDEQKESSKLYEPLSLLAPTIFPYLHFHDVKEKINNVTEGVDV
ncbi:CvpA family protein [Marinilabiliaceae bacterium JC017]|nr:CvpA family protein [Marinilabiliaceae bacterium JC017]